MNVRSVLTRTAALVAVVVVGQIAAAVLPKDGGANIGLGLAVFAVCALLAALLGAFDRRRERLRTLAPGWLAVGLGVGVAAAFCTSLAGALYGGGASGAVLAADVVSGAPFFAVLIVVPALLGAFVSGAAGSARQPHLPG